MWTTIRSDRHAPRLAGVALALLLGAPTGARADDARDVDAEPAPAAPAATRPDALDSLRGRFREGMDKYKAGSFADAIVIWESIYRELGSDTGYRLAFDLARAYDQLDEAIKAADHYDTYLERVRQRREQGETLEPNVAKQEELARERRDIIVRSKGRIRVHAAARGTSVVRIDNTPARVAPLLVYVEPGTHTVSIGNGRDLDVRTVEVARGALVEIAATEAARAPEPAAPRFETRTERPFSPTVLWIGAGAAAVSLVVPIITYANALSIKGEYEDPATPSSERGRLASDYDSARSNAYASIVVPALFTAAVGTLSLWYVLGAKQTRVPIAPAANIGPTGASLGMSGHF